ncbi:hypothetical protein BD410DRAFT_781673 [Rickenella mellea]|uniref:Uncharacterized protein n=1 Tax=Rickenella mellea TaxID=50990 RepID=A0A4Y7QLK0_9AGAM|nr:hypothetical protein BD410DRAFT_781673 [Rickenella mellea]
MKNNEELQPAGMFDYYFLAYPSVILVVLTAQHVTSKYSLRIGRFYDLRWRLTVICVPQYWLAVCAIPDTKPAVQRQERQSRWWIVLLLLKAAGLVVFGVALYYTYRAMGRHSPEVDAILSALLFPIATSALIGLFSAETDLPAISVHRNSAGALVDNQLPLGKSEPVSMDTLFYMYLPPSLSICASTFILEFGFFILITLVASIGMFSNWGRAFNSMRPCAVAFFGCIVAVVTATVLLLYSESAGNWTDASKSPYSYSPSLGRLPVYELWLAVIACSSLPVSLTSFCLRFDYYVHLEHLAQPSTEHFAVNEEPSPRPTLGPGVVIPSHIPSKFSKPYFLTSIVTFVFAATAVLAYLPSFGIILDRLGVSIFMMVMVVAVFPLQCIAVIVKALRRGEWHILSDYKEEWVRIPAKTDINLEEGSGRNFESVPIVDVIEHSSDDR